VVGDVIGKYHPHGDTAVYDAIVRMAQPFSLRYMLVDGQGNFGSVDGDFPAAMRYTEIRMRKLTHELLADLDKETVDWVPNYDGTEQMPAVMPSKVPNLLINGSSGIAVGMATNIPPHNLSEVIKGCLAVLDNPDITIDELMEFIPGPDFPTAAIINGRAGIVEAYRTGRGRIRIRSRAVVEVDEKTHRETIIVSELPYQVNKARLIEKIAELVKEKKLEGISELRDESDKDGLRVVIEIKRGEMGDVVLNNLYAQTQLETVFGINMVALVDGQPRLLNLKQLLEAFIRHRREVVTRRTVYLLRKARERGHILEGLAVAISNIDPVIELIKASANTQEAREKLLAKEWEPGDVMAMLARAGENACRPDDLPAEFGMHDGRYHLSPDQVQAILDLRLQKLTGMEHEKLLEEYQEKLAEIAEYLSILANPDKLVSVIREELQQIAADFGDARRSEITVSQHDLSIEDLINEEDRVVTISHGGYAKTQPLTDYQAQKRGGMGKSATAVKDEDFVEHLLIASSHDTILCFTNVGKVYWLKVYQIPVAGRGSRGRPMINLLPLDEGERVTAILPVDLKAGQQEAVDEESDEREGGVIEGELIDDAESADEEVVEADEVEGETEEWIGEASGTYIFMATAQGSVKKMPLAHFYKPRSTGLIALKLKEGDTLIAAAITNGAKEVMLFSDAGKVIRFAEDSVRTRGRIAGGIRGMRLGKGQKLIAMLIPESGAQILTASERGYGKRTLLGKFPRRGKGGQGVIAMQINERNGGLAGAVQVFSGDELMLISDQGTMVRTRTDEVSELSRNTQGVRVIRLKEGEKLVGVERIPESPEIEMAIGDDETTADIAVDDDYADQQAADNDVGDGTDASGEE
ncbi:MAG TPA: DNA gyrase subunit A, partial [Spongiibacteraceae bacterium]|nr:DNA gyrase subunit A [Spongiibacteraceae bacterium]